MGAADGLLIDAGTYGSTTGHEKVPVHTHPPPQKYITHKHEQNSEIEGTSLTEMGSKYW